MVSWLIEFEMNAIVQKTQTEMTVLTRLNEMGIATDKHSHSNTHLDPI